MRKLKETLSCAVCGLSGEDNAWALEFHHRNPEEKDYLISGMVAAGLAKKRILTEIEKCDVICSNCHRRDHYTDHRRAVESGEKSIWIEAGEAGAASSTFGNDSLTRQKKRRRKRRKQRQRAAKKELEGDTSKRSGPPRQMDNDIDSLLYKVENGGTLDAAEAARLRRLLKRARTDHLQMEGEIHDADIEFDTKLNRNGKGES